MVSGKDVAIAFSGGLDSGLLAVLCGMYARSVTLYTVGTEGSYDVRESRHLSATLGMEWVHIAVDEASLVSALKGMMDITGATDPVFLSFEVPLMHVLSTAKEDIVITGQGADEVFLGYSKYVGLSDADLGPLVSEDTDRLRSVTRIHESAMAKHHGKTVLCPYLDPRVTEAVSHIPLDEIRPSEGLRKVPLRRLAESMQHPEIASKQKKAAQYGSGTMNLIRRMAKSRSLTISAFLIGVKDLDNRE